MESWEADILVVGAGAAGLSVALHAAPRRVLLLAPEGPTATATSLAKGGIAAPIGRGDSIALRMHPVAFTVPGSSVPSRPPASSR